MLKGAGYLASNADIDTFQFRIRSTDSPHDATVEAIVQAVRP